VRAKVALRLLDFLPDLSAEQLGTLAKAIPDRVALSSAWLASHLAQRGQLAGVAWFKHTIETLKDGTPEFVSNEAANAVEFGSAGSWSTDEERKRVIRKWLGLLARLDHLKWSKKLLRFVGTRR